VKVYLGISSVTWTEVIRSMTETFTCPSSLTLNSTSTSAVSSTPFNTTTPRQVSPAYFIFYFLFYFIFEIINPKKKVGKNRKKGLLPWIDIDKGFATSFLTMNVFFLLIGRGEFATMIGIILPVASRIPIDWGRETTETGVPIFSFSFSLSLESSRTEAI